MDYPNGSMVYMSQVCNVFISRMDRHLIITLFAGWTDMETISLETGETATLPPVCRGTTTTESAKFKYLLFNWINLIGSAKELLFN